jgi:hypothetical protein
MTRKKYYKKKYYRKRSNSNNQEIDPIVWGIVWLFVFSYMTYHFFILPNIEAFKFYWAIWLIVIAILLTVYLIYMVKVRIKKTKAEDERINNIPNFVKKLDDKIKEFKPIKQHTEEIRYQLELVWFLKNDYPDVKIEKTREYSRPDIIIDEIAIEIKWPTNMSCLKTLPDKINSYLSKWDYLFIVLFNIQIVEDKEKNLEIYEKKKKEILENIIESKRNKVFFIEIQ